MKFYAMSLDPDASDLMTIVDYQLGAFNSLDIVLRDRRLQNLPSEVQLIAVSGDEPDYVGNPLSWPICSSRLLAAVNPFLKKGEIFQAPISIHGDSIDGFYILHNLIFVEGLDEELSDIMLSDSGDIDVVYSVVVDENKTNGHDIFRLKEWPYELIVSEKVAESVTKAGANRGLVLLDRSKA